MPKTTRKECTTTTEAFRDDVCHEYFIEGQRLVDISKKYKIPSSTVYDIVNRYRQEQRTAYKPRGGAKNVKIKDEHSDFLRDLIDNEDEENILTLDQLKSRLKEKFPEDFPNNESIGEESIKRHIDSKLNFTLKRTKTIQERQLDGHTINERKEYSKKVVTGNICYLNNCIFVDECRFNACMVPGRTRSTRGKKTHIMTKTKRTVNISIVGALSSARVELLTAKMAQCGTNAAMFEEFIGNLFEKLEERYPGEKKYIIMNNVNFHISPLIKKKFQNSIHEACYLPPSSPTFNPTESCFSTLRSFVRRSPNVEKVDMLYLIAESRKAITSDTCKRWVTHCVDSLHRCLEIEGVNFEN